MYSPIKRHPAEKIMYFLAPQPEVIGFLKSHCFSASGMYFFERIFLVSYLAGAAVEKGANINW